MQKCNKIIKKKFGLAIYKFFKLVRNDVKMNDSHPYGPHRSFSLILSQNTERDQSVIIIESRSDKNYNARCSK